MSSHCSAIYIGLGANLGDRGQALRQAVHALAHLPGTQVQAVSSLYSSAPVAASGPDYLNAVACLSSLLPPQTLLEHLQTLETAAGRERPYLNAPRTLDLDLLRYGDIQMDTPRLVLPHPRMYSRAFVLLPLAELAPHLVNTAHLAAVADQAIHVLHGPQWVDMHP